MTYRINDKTCTGCGSCLDICPADAIQMVDGKAVITLECIDCGACPRVCPEGSIAGTFCNYSKYTITGF